MRAILIPFHKYTPFGGEHYEPLLNYCLDWAKKYRNEYDSLYLIDSDWNMKQGDYTILKKQNDGHHWVQFKDAIPYIKEDNMLFLDNDVLILQPGIIDSWFKKIEEGYDFVGSFDGSGTNQTVMNKYPWMKEKGYNRMGSYYFILTKKLLEKVGEYDFAPQDGFDSFGKFTLQMMETNPEIWEIPDWRDEDVSHGYYHIRGGSTVPYLLASKHYGHEEDYWNYLKNQPKSEYIRQCKWHRFIGGDPSEIEEDSNNV